MTSRDEQYRYQKMVNALADLKKAPKAMSMLIDMADGHFLEFDTWAWQALVRRDLVALNLDDDRPRSESPFQLTDFGQEFVAWMRRPKDLDLNVQHGLWGDES